MATKNVLHYDKKAHMKTVQEAYSDDVYELVPFSCEARLSDTIVRSRIALALYKKFPPSHHAGCGYACNLIDFTRTSPTGGTVVIKHYNGIGD